MISAITPEGWEEGGEQYSSAGGFTDFPEGELDPGDVVSVGVEALSPEGSLHRVSLARTTLKSVP